MERYSEALKLNIDLEPNVKALHYQAGIQLVEFANEVDSFDEVNVAVQSLEEAKILSSSIGSSNEQLLKDLKRKLDRLSNYKSNIIIDYKMSKARYLQAIARSPRLTIGMTLPLIEELLGKPHEIIISKTVNQKEQLWVYFLNDKRLELSFKDFILFKIEDFKNK